MRQVEFTVPGIPAPQGSLVRTKFGVRDSNPATRPWRAAVAWEAAAVLNGDGPLEGPLELAALFFFPRPKSHYRTGKLAGQLKPGAPDWHATKPDADKLLRAIGDALSGVLCHDDAQFVRVSARKLYGLPRALVTVREAVE